MIYNVFLFFLFGIFIGFISTAIFSFLGVENDIVAVVYHSAVAEINTLIPTVERGNEINDVVIVFTFEITHVFV